MCRKRELFRVRKKSRNDEDRKIYCVAKKQQQKTNAERVVYIAMGQKA